MWPLYCSLLWRPQDGKGYIDILILFLFEDPEAVG